MIGDWDTCCEIALKRMSLHLTDDKSTSVQVMAWWRQATSHYMNHLDPCRHMMSLGHNVQSSTTNILLIGESASVNIVNKISCKARAPKQIILSSKFIFGIMGICSEYYDNFSRTPTSDINSLKIHIQIRRAKCLGHLTKHEYRLTDFAWQK